MNKAALGIGAGIATPIVLVMTIALAAGGATAVTPAAVAGTSNCSTPVTVGSPAAGGVSLTSEQVSNAQIIYQVSADLNLPQQAAVIAIATAMQESSLVNLPSGDLDSIGLFQQRPSQGWGSPSQLMDPVYASKAFYSRLVQVSNWQNLPVGQAAQDVQQSAYPDAYAKWESLARQLVAAASGGATNCSGGDGDGNGGAITNPVSLPEGFTLPTGTPVAVVTAIKFAVSKLGLPYQWGGTGDPSYDCSGLMMMAYQAAGVTITRTTYTQVNDGTPVYNASDLKPGDLIFTAGSDGTPTNPGHVGMFLGDDLVIDAPRTGENIEITKFDDGYWNKEAVAFRRIVQ
ncbi:MULTISPECIES: NlpC/P60 family protein [Streptacidiphilus]|uniref:NlpC/P60 family protein n=1 Tax=Streptacidiphilus cavernicola TaxID=3342716 RepID=A0ABV6V0Z0_9ACTN|nr:NlpC/P60 family protein [Streptacidiphilus jeojiense]